MNVDAVAGGALMKKTYTGAYVLIKEMAQNPYQWTSERAITVVTPLPSKKEAGMYEVSTLDHLFAKVDTIFQKYDKLSVSVVTPAPVSPPCDVCGILGHTGVECQLGSVVESPEQLNYDQYDQGMRSNQIFYNKTPQNPFRQQTTPPSYANNQRVPQKSRLEVLLEKYVMDQSKQFQEIKNQTGFLNDCLVKLTSKADFIATHTKMLENQISQVAQQVATSSQTPGVFPSQTEINPKGRINATTLRDGKILEDPVVKSKIIEGEIKSEKPQSEKAIGESDEPIVSPPHKPKILFPQRLAKPKLKDPSSFSIPCVIRKETIDKAMCDLGSSVSLLPLSLLKRIGIGDLKPTKMTLQLADRSIIYPARILEDIPIRVGNIYFLADFVVVDIKEDSEMPILLGRPFLATTGAVINVKYGKIFFHVGDEKVEFEISKLMKGSSIFDSCCMIDVIDHRVKECSLALSTHNGLRNPD